MSPADVLPKEEQVQDDGWDNDAHNDPDSGSGNDGDDGPPSQGKPNAPMQKRRRVTRACDECRRKKIKCDGKQPCTHCTVYSYDCTYDQPSNRRRNPVPAYVEALEQRVQRAEGLIQMIAPNLDMNDPAIDLAVRAGIIPPLRPNLSAVPPNPQAPPRNTPGLEVTNGVEVKKEIDLESMVRAVGTLELDENGNADYHGHSSGLSFIRRMREQLGDMLGPDTGSTPFVKNRPVSNVIDSPKSTGVESPMDSMSPTAELPVEHVARELCNFALNLQSSLIRVLHFPSFWASFQRVFTLPADQFNNDDHKFLPVLYSVMAVGSVWGADQTAGYDSFIDKGFKFFKAARQMMDIADIRDIASLQAVVFMTIYLQSSAKLSQCYSYIGVAMSGAVRMGIHRSIPSARFSPIETELRKRIFWSIRKYDIYIGALLGLPQTLDEQDIDQDFPEEVDDEYITEDGVKPMPDGSTTLMAAFNVHTRLACTLSKIVKTVYPIRPSNALGGPNKSYTVPFSKIREIEQEMEDWKRDLPAAYDPSNPDPRLQRTQQSLRLTYAFNQFLLYRPFLHFVGSEQRAKQTDQRAYACAASYVNVCRNLVHLCDTSRKTGNLSGALWFSMYITFFAILSLVYFAAENPDNPTTQDLLKDAAIGKEILASVAESSMSADRVSSTLEVIWKRLPEWMREGRPNPAPRRKRKPTTQGMHPTAIPRNVAKGLGVGEQTNGPSNTSAPAGMTSAGGSEGPFTPQNVNFPTTGYTPTDYSPTTQTLQQFGLQPNSNHGENQDLSAMFSSTEPFSYPSQPLTTFENSRNMGDAAFHNSNPDLRDPSAMIPPGLPRNQTAEMDAQLYSLPPFVMQGGQWSSNLQGMGDGAMSAAQAAAPPQQYLMTQGTTNTPPNWQQQQHAMFQDSPFQDVNLNDIFGGTEWNGSLVGHYQH